MPQTEMCPRCKQPLPSQERGGVYLPSMKARIFVAIRDNPGITTERLLLRCFEGNANRNTLSAHIWQINLLLSSTNLRVSGKEIGRCGHYHIIEDE